MSERANLVWFRRDLRLRDNAALHAACDNDASCVAIYILDDETYGKWAMGAASRWWLHHSLTQLQKDLAAINIPLILKKGKADAIITAMADDYEGIYWNRLYDPHSIARDTKIKDAITHSHSFKGSVLFEPWDVTTKAGDPCRVYSPFKKACYAKGVQTPLLDAPKKRSKMPAVDTGDSLNAWDLLPHIKWDTHFPEYWIPGEDGAQKRMDTFIKTGLAHYKEGRDFPAEDYTSRISPHLHFGEISPARAWVCAQGQADDKAIDKYHSELLWREFSVHLLYHFPYFPEQPMQPRFADFPWRESHADITAWQKGLTGYPIADAGMRQLWQTGWMHNRVRMIVGSILVKHLLLPWQDGQDWFWDTLVDADLANNSAGWQWIGGCGADAAPYFRVFNPMLQGKKFDAEGDYVRRYVPELAKMPKEFIHEPWEAPQHILDKAGVILGETYPYPIVDHKEGRDRALKAFEVTKNES